MNLTDEQKRKLLKLLKRLTGANHSEFGSKRGLKAAQKLYQFDEDMANELKLASLSDADFFISVRLSRDLHIKYWEEDPIVDGYRKPNDKYPLDFFEEAKRRWANVEVNYPKDND